MKTIIRHGDLLLRQIEKLPKIKKYTYKSAKKLAWKEFSIFIRNRDKGICFTCGKKQDWKLTDAGHYISGNVCGIVLYFDERNVNCQCTGCNRFRHGNLTQYALHLIEKYGGGILAELHIDRLKTKDKTYSVKQLLEIRDKYKLINYLNKLL